MRVPKPEVPLTAFIFTANARTTNDNDRPWTQQNGPYAAWNLYYVDEGDITQGFIGYLNLAIVCPPGLFETF